MFFTHLDLLSMQLAFTASTANAVFDNNCGHVCACWQHQHGASVLTVYIPWLSCAVLLQVGTTVSPTYAAEVSGHPSVAPHMNKFFGIINGIDMDIWDPQSDQFLPR